MYNPWSRLKDAVELNYKKAIEERTMPQMINKLTSLSATGTCIYLLEDPKWLKRFIVFHIDVHNYIDLLVSRDACLNSQASNETLRILARSGYRFGSGFPNQKWINEYQLSIVRNKKYVIILLALKRRRITSMVHLDRFLIRELAFILREPV